MNTNSDPAPSTTQKRFYQVARYRILPLSGADPLRVAGAWVAALGIADAFTRIIRFAEWPDVDEKLVFLTQHYKVVYDHDTVFHGVYGETEWSQAADAGLFDARELYFFPNGALTSEQMRYEEFHNRYPERRKGIFRRLEEWFGGSSELAKRRRRRLRAVVLSLAITVCCLIFWQLALQIFMWSALAGIAWLVIRNWWRRPPYYGPW